MRNTAAILWLLMLLAVLAGCTAGETVIEITYPAQTDAAVSAAAEASSVAETEEQLPDTEEAVPQEGTYVLNTGSKKFHDPSCSSVPTIKEKNREEYTGDRAALIERGFSPCKRCNP